VPALTVEPSVPLAPPLRAVPIAPPAVPIPAVAAAPVQTAPVPAAVSQAVAAIPPRPRRAVAVAQPPVIGLNPIGVALVYLLDSLRVTPRQIVAIGAVLMLVPTTFAGVFVYNYLHPQTVMRYSDAPAAVQAPDVPADALAGEMQDTPASTVPGVRQAAKPQLAVPHTAAGRADEMRQARAISKPQSQASVWPPPPDSTETPIAAGTMASASRPSRLTGPPESSIYVPSSTMIKYAVSAPKPVYPLNRAKSMDVTVDVQLTISKQGEVTSVQTMSGPPEFRSAAVQAVRTWRFRPYLFNGSPADVETMLEIRFGPQ
jgi:TonB family protein